MFQNYTCEISAWKPPSLTHTVVIRREPEIEIFPQEDITVHSGESLKLKCTPTAGKPAPLLKWRKAGVEGLMEGGEVNIEHVSRSDAGQYTCEAQNGYKSEPVTQSINVVVHCKF